jgi:hypothetical protein
MNFMHLREGDKVIRLMGGKLRMTMVVREVQADLVVCDAIDKETKSVFRGGWTFDRNSGIEEDADLGWGVSFGRTGSVLINEEVTTDVPG